MYKYEAYARPASCTRRGNKKINGTAFEVSESTTEEKKDRAQRGVRVPTRGRSLGGLWSMRRAGSRPQQL